MGVDPHSASDGYVEWASLMRGYFGVTMRQNAHVPVIEADAFSLTQIYRVFIPGLCVF